MRYCFHAGATFLYPHLRALVPRRVYPDRPLLGAPLGLPGFLFEPTNEMGVVLLFGMLFWRLGFIIESAQIGYPDCRAKLEVEPGRWQDVGIEFEHQSRHFLAHRHDPSRCDILVCWIHNWKNCPPNLQVVELREVVRRLAAVAGFPTAQFLVDGINWGDSEWIKSRDRRNQEIGSSASSDHPKSNPSSFTPPRACFFSACSNWIACLKYAMESFNPASRSIFRLPSQQPLAPC